MNTFYNFLLRLEAGEAPPPPPPGGGAGGAPPPGGDPLGGMGGPGGAGADPMGGAGGAGGAPGGGQPRKSINVTTWEDALRSVLGKDAHRPPEPRHHDGHSSRDKAAKEDKKPKSLMQ